MQEAKKFPLDISVIARENELKNIDIPLKPGSRIFFVGDLGSGKSTLIRMVLREYFQDPSLVVRSPTYTYFQKYGANIYHFDLYRLTSLEDFFLIGGDDIMNDPEAICLIEWPELLMKYIEPTMTLTFEKISETSRKITLTHPSGSTE